MPRPANSLHQGRQRRGIILAALGAALGMLLLVVGHFPLVKINSGTGDLAVLLIFALSLFLRWSAWKEQGQVMSALLWLACGMASLWTVLQFVAQNSMQ